jgi:hypothetical protein
VENSRQGIQDDGSDRKADGGCVKWRHIGIAVSNSDGIIPTE